MKLTQSEWQIMNALWDKNPVTARELAEHLPDDVHWAYTTIKTMLSRLVIKEAVSERKRGNTSVYEPLISRTRARGSALHSLINQAFDGAVEPLVHSLVDGRKLSKKEREKLIRILREEDSKTLNND
jgi:BlaI family penicillinase repressor